VVIGCSSGSIYRCMAQSLTAQLITTAHTSPITCLKFGTSSTLERGEGKGSSEDDRTGFFVTGTSSGELRVWDIADYTCLGYYKETKTHSTSSLNMSDGVTGGVGNSVQSVALYGQNNSHVISGWKDGSVKCHDISLQRVVWLIPQAHRDGVTTIAVCSSSALSGRNAAPTRGPPSSSGLQSRGAGGSPCVEYLVTGGKDGAIRIWKLSTRELVTQYSEHTKSVSRVLVDSQTPNIIHSSSSDGTVISFDLQANQRKVSHILSSGKSDSSRRGGGGGGGSTSLTDMTQRLDSECEVVTCDTGGRLITWDIDIRDPVMIVQDISEINPSLTCCMVSPVTGLYLAFGGSDGILKVLDIQRNQIVSLGRGHSDEIVCLSWTPDERQIITGGRDNCMCIWNYYLGGVR
jgi:cilia- and flagella-associated protein 52